MKIIKQHPKSNDCMACVAAMLCNTTPQHFKNFCKKRRLNKYEDSSLIRYIQKYGWLIGIYFKTFTNSLSVDIRDAVCILGVKSNYKRIRKNGDEHVVIWDGKQVLDSNPKVNNKSLSKYKITSIIPLCKCIG